MIAHHDYLPTPRIYPVYLTDAYGPHAFTVTVIGHAGRAVGPGLPRPALAPPHAWRPARRAGRATARARGGAGVSEGGLLLLFARKAEEWSCDVEALLMAMAADGLGRMIIARAEPGEASLEDLDRLDRYWDALPDLPE
jgi:hypothetical protein